MTKLRGKVIWITGASGGLGEALAYEFAREGARLILSARRKHELERVKANCNAAAQENVRVLPLDLAQPESLQLSTDAAVQIFGHIDILVNNAGLRQRSRVDETPLDSYRRIMEVNYFGTIALTKFLLPHFVSRREGHFVNISSLAGKFGTPHRSGYAASKHALHGFFDALRAEHHHDNIFVTMICPGFIRPALRSGGKTFDSETKVADASFSRGKPAQWCAQRILHAVRRRKEEIYIGGREVLAVYVKRWFPTLFSKIIRRVPVR